MHEMFKVCILNANGTPEHVLTFANETEYERVFSEEEKRIYPKNIVHFVNSRIYLDDTIQTVKQKIWNVCHKTSFNNVQPFAYEDMYIFGVVESPFQLLPWYKEATNYEQESLSKERILKMLTNYVMQNSNNQIDLLLNSETFQNQPGTEITFEQLEDLDWFRETIKMEKMCLGSEFLFQTPPNLRNRDAYFCVNPFESKFSTSLKIPTSQPIQQENHFLFHKGLLKSNTVYLCLSQFVFEYGKREQIQDSVLLQQYYPLIANNTLYDDYIRNIQPGNIEKTRTTINQEHLILQNKYIDHIVQVHQHASSLSYKDNGVKSFYFIKHPYETKVIPIQTIFKRIHVSEHIPIIQLSSPIRENSTYRIHSTENTFDGTPIPSLVNLMKTDVQVKELKHGSKEEQLVLFLKIDPTKPVNTLKDLLRLSFERNGNVHVQGNMDLYIDIHGFESWMSKTIQPGFDAMNEVLVPLGYRIDSFDSIYHPYVQTIYIHYGCILDIGKQLDIEPFNNCLSSLLIPKMEKQPNIRKPKIGKTKTNKSNTNEMIYWRVENFEKLNEEELFLSQLVQSNYNRVFKREQLKKALLLKYPNKDPELIMTQYELRQGQRIIPSRYTNQENSQKTNGGFLTIMSKVDSFSYTYQVEVKFIHHVSYLKTVPAFIDSILKMVVHPSDSTLQICSGNKINAEQFVTNAKVDKMPSLVDASYELPNVNEMNQNDVNEVDDIQSNLSGDASLEDDETDIDSSVKLQNEKGDEEIDDEEIDDENMDNENILQQVEQVEQVEEDEEEQIEKQEEKGDDDDDDDDDDDGDNDGEDEDDDVYYEDEDDEDEDDEMQGGGKKKEGEWTAAIDYYLVRIKQRDPELENEMQKNNYPRLNQKERPIILTEEEKQKVDKLVQDPKYQSDYDEFYKDTLKYRKDQNGNYLHYICPKYWCTKPNQEGPLTEEEANSGICGNIIQNKSKRKENEYVLKNDIKGDVFPKPGFVNRNAGEKKEDEDGNPICFPKCMQKLGEAQTKLKKECNPDIYDNNAKNAKGKPAKPKSKKSKPENTDEPPVAELPSPVSEETLTESSTSSSSKCPAIKPVELYINDNKKRALINTAVYDKRLGRLPPSIQTFLHSKYTQNLLEVNAKNSTLLRYGLVKTRNNKHSFLACLADIYSFTEPKYQDKTIDIDDFRNVLAGKITLDMYITLHNGSIASIFQPSPGSLSDSIQVNKYNDSELYKTIDTKDETQYNFLQYTIASYENFQKYLRDVNNVIEPTYMWEIVSSPLLFCGGYNMVIIEHFEDNNQVGIMCPNNPYVTPIFNPTKSTFLLLKQKNVYTPLYLIRSEERKGIREDRREQVFYVTKVFKKEPKTRTMNAILDMLERNINMYCSPRNPIKPKDSYIFEHGLSAVQTRALIRKNGDSIAIQNAVWNYQGKIVAFLVKWNNKPVHITYNGPFYLPCFPSTMSNEYFGVKWVDDVHNWADYKSTIAFLNHMYELGQNMNIPVRCRPKTRVVQKENIIGVLTESHHFVQIHPSIKHENIENDPLNQTKPIIHSNPITADKHLAIHKPSIVQNKDNHHLELEQQFYMTFRNRLRIAINSFTHTNRKRKELIDIVLEKQSTKTDKITRAVAILTSIGQEYFTFNDYDENSLNKLQKIKLCGNTCTRTLNCIPKDDGSCSLKIPKTNLQTQENNEVMYYRRVAEEMLFNRTTYLYLLYNQHYIDYDNDNVLTTQQEMILPYSKMNSKYFQNLHTRNNAEYVTKNNYQNTSGKTNNMILNWEKEFRGK